MKKLVNWANWLTNTNRIGEINDKPSMTVPGQTLSLKELLLRYTRGQDVQVYQPVYAGDDPDFPDHLEYMDPQERLDAARSIQGAIYDAQVRNAQLERAAQDAAKEK